MLKGIRKWVSDYKQQVEKAKEFQRAETKARDEAEQARLATVTEIFQRVIQTLEEGRVPEVYTGTETLPFWLNKNEALIFCQYSVEYAETKIRREYEGASVGVSLPMAGNTYLHSNDSWGTSEEREVIAQVEWGIFAVSTRHLFFSGEKRNFRIPLPNIISARRHPSLGGIEIVRDQSTIRPQYFGLDDPEAGFVAQMIQMLPTMDLGTGRPKTQRVDGYFNRETTTPD